MSCKEEDLFDIEDIVSQIPQGNEATRKETEKLVFPKRTTNGRKVTPIGYDIPGTQTVFLKTYGCAHNQSDSEYMAGQLVDYGYGITEKFEKADAFLINSCTVKGPSQAHFENLVAKAKSTGKPVIVCGCVPQGQPNSKTWDGLSVIGVQQINRVIEVVEEALRGNTVRFLSRTKKNRPTLDLPKVRRNPFIEIIPINVGCLNQCTYCKTKHARGHLGSWTPEEIVSRTTSVIPEGVKEIRITSEDTGAYGRDIGTDLPTLLRGLVEVLPESGDVMLKVGMTNPPYILEHLEAIAEILNHPNVFSFLHIPVQSGSNRVLDDMKREYTVEEFKRIVDFLREKVPNILIATDIICGFPTETEDDFKETLELVQQYQFPVLNISQFYPRPGTPAARMKLVPTQEVKSRSRELTKLFESYRSYDYLVGTEQRVWICERASDGTKLAGRTKCYVQVLVDPKEAELGTNVICEIISADKWSVIGKVKYPLKKKKEKKPVFSNQAGAKYANYLEWNLMFLFFGIIYLLALYFPKQK